MRRTRQQCVSCTPTEWRRISELARASNKSISRFVIESVLRPEHSLVLSGEQQEDILNRVNRLLLICEDLADPLPGCDVTLAEAVAFLVLEGKGRSESASQQPGTGKRRRTRDGGRQADLFGET